MGDDKDELLDQAFSIICDVDKGTWEGQEPAWWLHAQEWKDRYNHQKPINPSQK